METPHYRFYIRTLYMGIVVAMSMSILSHSSFYLSFNNVKSREREREREEKLFMIILLTIWHMAPLKGEWSLKDRCYYCPWRSNITKQTKVNHFYVVGV